MRLTNGLHLGSRLKPLEGEDVVAQVWLDELEGCRGRNTQPSEMDSFDQEFPRPRGSPAR